MAIHHICDVDVAYAPFWTKNRAIGPPAAGEVCALAAHRAAFESRCCTPAFSGGADKNPDIRFSAVTGTISCGAGGDGLCAADIVVTERRGRPKERPSRLCRLAPANVDGFERQKCAEFRIAHAAYVSTLPWPIGNMLMPTPAFRFPDILNSRELLVAEAIQARALTSLDAQGLLAVGVTGGGKAQTRLDRDAPDVRPDQVDRRPLRCSHSVFQKLFGTSLLYSVSYQARQEESMADDNDDHDPRDKSRLGLSQDREARYWSDKLGISRSQLKDAVYKFVDSVDAVEKELRRRMLSTGKS